MYFVYVFVERGRASGGGGGLHFDFFFDDLALGVWA